MNDLATILPLVRATVDKAIGSWIESEQVRSHSLGDLGDGALGPIDAASDLLQGGKRMRAALAVIGMGLAAGSPDLEDLSVSAPARDLGAALELYQASALIHDDVVDDAMTRRGRPAAHQALSRRHHDSGWLASPSRHGVNAAILLGDLLLSASGELMGRAVRHAVETGTQPSEALAARDRFDSMTHEVALGQLLDLHQEVLPLPGPHENPQAAGEAMQARALEVVRYKAARYSVMHPLLLGSLLAPVAPAAALAEALPSIGEEIGIAFQLRDDVLGVFGDPVVTGKPAQDDLREGKRTVLLSLAWQMTDDRGRALLTSVLASPEASAPDRAEAAALIRRCGALEAHEQVIAWHLDAGVARLSQLEESLTSGSARQVLCELAGALTMRQA